MRKGRLFINVVLLNMIFFVILAIITTTKIKITSVINIKRGHSSIHYYKKEISGMNETGLHQFFQNYEESSSVSQTENVSSKTCGSTYIACNVHLCTNMPQNGAVLYIYSEPGNRAGRDIVRETYASNSVSEKIGIRRFFALGIFHEHINNSMFLYRSLKNEMELYNDLVIGDFVDSYENLTLKGLTALKFIAEYCSNAKWVIKVDNDVVADTPHIISYLRYHASMKERAIFGHVVQNAAPFICPRVRKWCINRADFPHLKRYPTYVSGIGYAFTTDLVKPMLKEADKTAYYRKLVDDVYMTGFLTRNLKKTFVHGGRHVEPFNKNMKETMADRRVLMLHLPSQEHIRFRWKQILEAEEKGTWQWRLE